MTVPWAEFWLCIFFFLFYYVWMKASLAHFLNVHNFSLFLINVFLQLVNFVIFFYLDLETMKFGERLNFRTWKKQSKIYRMDWIHPFKKIRLFRWVKNSYSVLPGPFCYNQGIILLFFSLFLPSNIPFYFSFFLITNKNQKTDPNVFCDS